MDDGAFHNEGFLDDRRAYIAAAAAMARLDEALSLDPRARSLYLPVSRRREAAAIASLDGFLVRPEALCRLISDPDMTGADRGTRRAFDIHRALAEVEGWPTAGPDVERVAAAFASADASSGRLSRPETDWTIEEDSAWLSDQLAAFAETAEPWTAAETIRKVWTSGRFFGTARRMAAIAAAWVVPTGFGCRSPFYGFAATAASDTDALREDAKSPEAWAMRFGSIAVAAGEGGRSTVTEALAAKATLMALCPPGRATSSVEDAVGFMFVNPVFTAKALSEALGLTDRGAKVVIDRLCETGAIEADNAARNRKFTCRRTM